jgi:hypothetical protein
MKTIIINGQRELAELPELWYTDGTNEANEWCRANEIYGAKLKLRKFIANDINYNAQSLDNEDVLIASGYIKLIESEFRRLVYQPWKESRKVKLPATYNELTDAMEKKSIKECSIVTNNKAVFACGQLTNIMNFANDTFEGDGKEIEVDNTGRISNADYVAFSPIRFTSKAAAEWAYKTFPEIFKAYWNA